MTIIQLPNGQQAEFPDEMSREDIKAVVQKKFPPLNQKQDQQPKVYDTMFGKLPYNGVPFVNDPKMLNEMIRTAAIGPGFGPQYGLYKTVENILPKSLSYLENPFKGALVGGALSPEHPVFGSAIGALGGAVPGAVGTTINKLRPSNLFRGGQTAEQLQNALNVTQGTETPLGDVLQSPLLKHAYENVISKVPFSGAYETMQRTGQQIINKGQDIMTKLLGKNSPVNVERELYDTLVQANKFHRNLKNELYSEPDKISKNIGLKLELPQFSNLAKEYGNAIEETNILKTEPEIKSLMNRLKRYQEPVEEVKGKLVDVEGNPLVSKVKYPSLKEANILSSHLDDLAERYASSRNVSEQNLSNVFKRLAIALKNDVKNGVVNSGDKNLISSFNKAEKNYAENYSPFLEKEIYNAANNKNFDSDMIVQAFIKTGKATDRANLLEKFVTKLPEDKI